MTRIRGTATMHIGGMAPRKLAPPEPGPPPPRDELPLLGRTRGLTRKHRSGLFEAIFQRFPLELTQEILSYVAPATLFALARSCKQVRRSLMSTSAEPVWIKSMQNAEQSGSMPPCPEDLNVLQFLALLYDQQCTGCSKPVQTALGLTYRLRSCEDCFWKHFVTGPKARKLLRGSKYRILAPLLICFSEFPPHLKNSKDISCAYVSDDIQEVIAFYQDHGQDSPVWEDFVLSRQKLVNEEISKRRQETYRIKRWMIKHHFLHDRADFRYV